MGWWVESYCTWWSTSMKFGRTSWSFSVFIMQTRYDELLVINYQHNYQGDAGFVVIGPLVKASLAPLSKPNMALWLNKFFSQPLHSELILRKNRSNGILWSTQKSNRIIDVRRLVFERRFQGLQFTCKIWNFFRRKLNNFILVQTLEYVFDSCNFKLYYSYLRIILVFWVSRIGKNKMKFVTLWKLKKKNKKNEK